METEAINLVEYFTDLRWLFVRISTFIIFALVFIAIVAKTKNETYKKILFWGMVIPISVTTIFLTGSSIYINSISATHGPVHWHADFEIWECGEELNLIDPTGFSNKIGTPVLHEHSDKRVHVEGVVVDYQDVSLSEFFRVIEGSFTNTSWTIPVQMSETETANSMRENGDSCGDGEGTVQVYVYETDIDSKTFKQRKLENPADYVLRDETIVPPGDCIIIEFDANDEPRTDKLCETYEVEVLNGNLTEEM